MEAAGSCGARHRTRYGLLDRGVLAAFRNAALAHDLELGRIVVLDLGAWRHRWTTPLVARSGPCRPG
jgi:hypothetical protein